MDLDPNVRRLRRYLDERFPLRAVVTIADNASTDSTSGIAQTIATEVDGVRAVHLDRKGRGRAVKWIWATSDTPMVAYMDVDLATGLDARLPLVALLLSGHAEVAIGSRLAVGARVVRGTKRELISRARNAIRHTALRAGFSDARCGFKAIRTDVARDLIPPIEDDAWFFEPSSWCRPGGRACGSTKWRWTGWTTPTRGSTSPRPPVDAQHPYAAGRRLGRASFRSRRGRRSNGCRRAPHPLSHRAIHAGPPDDPVWVRPGLLLWGGWLVT